MGGKAVQRGVVALPVRSSHPRHGEPETLQLADDGVADGGGATFRPGPDAPEFEPAAQRARAGTFRYPRDVDRETEAAYKVPDVTILDKLPITATGTVRKGELFDTAQEN